jgi:hypothetical protein
MTIDLMTFEDEIACRDLFIGFACGQDRGDGEAMANLFSADGVLHRPGSIVRGRAGIAAHFGRHHPGLVMRNVVTDFVVEAVDRDHARGSCYYVAYRHVDAARPPADLPRPLSEPTYIGDYLAEFVRTPDGWRIAYYTVRRVFQAPDAA